MKFSIYEFDKDLAYLFMPIFYYLYFCGISYVVKYSLLDKRLKNPTIYDWIGCIVISLFISGVIVESIDYIPIFSLHALKIFLLVLFPLAIGLVQCDKIIANIPLGEREKHK